jgi:hypothetical protein
LETIEAMLTLKKYSDLDRIVSVFAGGNYNLFVLLGSPGHAKSRTVRAAVEASREPFLWVRNTVSAFRLYLDLFKNRQAKLLVIDDVDAFYADRNLVRLLKCLCETEEVKTLAWHTDAARLGREGVPREFEISMKVAVISNDLKRLNANVGALEDRGRVFSFEPDAREVHERARAFFDDAEIIEFIEARLGLLSKRLSLRDYWKAYEDKAGGLDWRRMFLEDKGLTDEGLVLAGLMTASYATEEERVREYVNLTGRSRATYFRRKREMSVGRDT